MEDSRRPFTPMIEPDTPTPEQSQSPRGRVSKLSRGGTSATGLGSEQSSSPSRRPTAQSNTTTAKKGNTGNSQKAAKSNNTNNSNTSNKEEEKTTNRNNKTKSKTLSSSQMLDSESSNLADLNELTSRLADEANNQLRSDSQTQMRAESSLSHQPPSTIIETGYVPFLVEPPMGKIEPGKAQTFKIKFAPLNVNDYQARLVCHIPNSEDGKQGATVAVKGKGLLPYCHFDLEENDYVTSGRRNPDLVGPGGNGCGIGLDPLTKVIEFKCIGLATKATRTFDIVNPTSVDYDFEWIKEEQNDAKKHDQFTCLQPHGKLLGGKKYEITFEYVPSEIEVQESFWRFRIPQFNLCVPFLLVGHATEPKVLFDKSHVSFKPLLVGCVGRETVHLINQESKAIQFNFEQTSCYTEGRSEVVLVEPAYGELPPNSKTLINLTFQPKEERTHIFNVKCRLLNSRKPIGINVKGVGFAMQTHLYCEDTYTGNKIDFCDTNLNEIHLGEVEKNETCFRNFFVSNTGKYPVTFEWLMTTPSRQQMPEASGADCFAIEPQQGQVEPGDKRQCILKYVAKHERLTMTNLTLKIENGSTYHVYVSGIAVKPDLVFSFDKFNFGPCFVYKAGMKLSTSTLTMTNRGKRDLNVVSLYDGSNAAFQLDFKQVILQPGKSAQATISFIPREYKSYAERFVFELNGLTRREVHVEGHGTQMRIELADSAQKFVELGTLQIGKVAKRSITIVNRSLAPVEFSAVLEPKSEPLT